MENKPLSIYIHIPFCVKKCAYCAFFSVPRRNVTLFDLYTEAVIKRLRSMDCHRVKSVYFGGGTPTVFGSDRLCRMLDAVFATQKVNAGAEITAEANPGTVSGTDFAVLSSAGFNRLSLGLQSADDAILKSIGRIHDLDMFLRCYDGAAKSFSNISVDIMFALPGGGVAETLGVINDIKPAHVSAYSLMLEMNTPMFENRDKYVFPGEDEEAAEYELISDTLSRSGYGH